MATTFSGGDMISKSQARRLKVQNEDEIAGYLRSALNALDSVNFHLDYVGPNSPSGAMGAATAYLEFAMEAMGIEIKRKPQADGIGKGEV